MSFQITTAFVEGFKNNIYMLSQQKNARLFNKSRKESQRSDTDYYEIIGETEANDVLDRHGDTPINNSPHTRRAVSLQDADWGDMIDKLDRVRLLIRPDDAYVKIAVAAMNRKKDDIFIAAALGIARSGRTGSTNVALPNAQKLVSVDEDGTTGSAPFSVYTLTLMLQKFEEADIDEDSKLYFAWSAAAKRQLLNQTKATSSDYTTVQALVKGQINSFMGFEFIRTQRLPVTAAATTYTVAGGAVGSGSGTLAAGARRCVAWVEDGMISATGIDLFAKMSERDDKRYSTQIYVNHSVGAVRMEEVKVIEVLVDESL